MAQISEFSLILVTLGTSQGHVGDDVVGLVTAVGLITITVSIYLIYASDRIYDPIEPLCVPSNVPTPATSVDLDSGRPQPDFVVIGLRRFGRAVLYGLQERGETVLGVDWDPQAVRGQPATPVVYVDAEDPDLPARLPLERTRWMISSLRGHEVNLALLSALRHHAYPGRVVVATGDEKVEHELAGLGAGSRSVRSLLPPVPS